MSGLDNNNRQAVEGSPGPTEACPPSTSAAPAPPLEETARTENRHWWVKLLVQPALLLVCGAILIAGLGFAQRLGLISAGKGGHALVSAAEESGQYICPMMCTPPQAEPGRCPVCGMELVRATSGGDHGDSRSIQIDPAARRVANIHTVAVKAIQASRTIRAIGELRYDEGNLKTIAAYVDGRLERLYADYTGVVVQEGDHLALVYSPQLYSGQVELLLSKRAREASRTATLDRVVQSSQELYENSKRRLLELGMTAQQIDELEVAGQANSRLQLCAPISGTVIEKLAVEGQYVKVGDPIYRLADLSTVWLMLRLFPEDSAAVRYAQRVEAEVQSLPGRTFTGRVAFIDPNVDPKTRTVGVRVVIGNENGLLRVGDYAKATMEVPAEAAGDRTARVYDPDLADKWVSPRHPHVIESSPGKCRECGVDLVPASQWGFTDEPLASGTSLVVPRDAVLMAGTSSVAYVETHPGRFEIRRVVLGPSRGDEIAILSGLTEGERVATRGNFLIDSQMQLAGNPSLIDPTKGKPSVDVASDAVLAALSNLSVEDRGLAHQQRICPVTELQLGSMGPPLKVDVKGTAVFICCEACRKHLLEEPEKYLARLADLRDSQPTGASALQMDLPPMGDLHLIGDDANAQPAESLMQAELPQEGLR